MRDIRQALVLFWRDDRGAIAAVGMLVVAIAGTVFTALESRAAAKREEATQKLQAKLADTRAVQRDAQRREELERVLGSIRAARAGPGAGILSPTGLAFLDEANEVISTQRLREVASERQSAANFRSAAAFSRAKARNALIGGGLKVAAQLFSFAAGGAGGGAAGAAAAAGKASTSTSAGGF